MRAVRAAIFALALAACRQPSEMAGIYVNTDSSGTFFPCDSANVMLMVPDSGLAVQYRAVANAPREPLFVRLRGVKRRSGSIYDGRRWFQVQQVLEIRPRASGECPNVAHSVATVLPSEQDTSLIRGEREGQATVPEQFRGKWTGTQAKCGVPSEGSLAIYADHIDFYESRGRVLRVTVLNEGEVQVDLESSGEGQVWRSTRHFKLSDDGRSLTDVTTPRYPAVRVRCEEAL